MELLGRVANAASAVVGVRLEEAARRQVLLGAPDGLHISFADRLASAYGSLIYSFFGDDAARQVVAHAMLLLDLPPFDDKASFGELVSFLNSCAANVPEAVPFVEACQAFAVGVDKAVGRGKAGPDTWPELDGGFMEAIVAGRQYDFLSDDDCLRAADAVYKRRWVDLAPLSLEERRVYATRLVEWLKDADPWGMRGVRVKGGKKGEHDALLANLLGIYLKEIGLDPAEFPLRGTFPDKSEIDPESDLALKVAVVFTVRAAGSTSDDEALEALEEILAAMQNLESLAGSREDRIAMLCFMVDYACRTLGYLPEDEPPHTHVSETIEALRERGIHTLSGALADTAERLVFILAVGKEAYYEGEEDDEGEDEDYN
eukprot:tig00020816_g14164.t1